MCVFCVNRTDDLVKRLISLELASHVSSHVPLDGPVVFYFLAFQYCLMVVIDNDMPLSESVHRQFNTICSCLQSEKLKLKKEQLVAKVQRDENDRSSVEVQGESLFFNVAHSVFTQMQR